MLLAYSLLFLGLALILDQLDVDGREQREDVCLNDAHEDLHHVDDDEQQDPEDGGRGIAKGDDGDLLQQGLEEYAANAAM